LNIKIKNFDKELKIKKNICWDVPTLKQDIQNLADENNKVK
jgi:hypothetical protein